MLRLTDAALAHALALAASRGCPAAMRVRVIGGGCEGLTWDLAFGAAVEREGDVHRFTAGVKVVADGRSANHLRGAWIDVGEPSVTRLRARTSDGPAEFVLRNLPGRRTCGCGESFGA